MTNIEYVMSFLLMMLLCIVHLGAALSLTPVFAKQYIMGTGLNVFIFVMVLPLFHIVYPEFQAAQIPLLIIIFCFMVPILLMLFLAEFGLGMISCFAPQLNVFFMAMPVKSWLSMFFLL